MSYSRWGNSCWYTFWAASYAVVETRDNALFEICGSTAFTAKELRENLQSCLDKVKVLTGCNEEELKELTCYIERFLNDVDKEYPECQF